jgi:hypothetical protein
VIDEVKDDVERSPSMGHCWRGKSARGHQKRCVPPVIDERSERDAHLADDLRPKMQRVAGFAPRRERQIRPYSFFGQPQKLVSPTPYADWHRTC